MIKVNFILKSTVYSWEEGQPHIPKIRSRAIQQFVSWYEQVRDHSTNQLLWGDEVTRNFLSNSEI